MDCRRPDLLKTVVEGDSGVGKSSFIRRFTNDTFENLFPCTIGTEFVCTMQKIVKAKVGSREFKLQIWDHIGAERFHGVLAAYYRLAHGGIIAYSVTDRLSFNSIPAWANLIRRATPALALVLVGTKTDLGNEREVSYEEGALQAERLGMPFLETSAKTPSNVGQAFLLLMTLIEGQFGRTSAVE